MLTLLVVLQNAYDKGRLHPEAQFNPSIWRRELESSRTGIRLSRVTSGVDINVRYCNAAPGIGVGSRSRLNPDPKHVRRALRRVDPDVVLACGELAESTVMGMWSGDLLAIPHPAYMCLTNSLLDKCRRTLKRRLREGPGVRLAFRQRRGFVRTEVLDLG